MKKKTLAILSIVAVLLVVAIVVLVIAVNKSRGDVDNPKPTAKPTAAPTVEEPTAEPTEEPTPEPTAEPTADPVETLVSLREEALAEHSKIVEDVQYRFDIALEILEVVKGYPNFEENNTYEMVLWTKSKFEKTTLEGDINDIIGSSNALNTAIANLLVEYPDLKTTEEFKKLVDAPALGIVFYNGKADVYNSTLSNSTISEFEELPYCTSMEKKLEY